MSRGNSNHCLKILENIFGQRQVSQTWSLHFKKGLQAYGFVQSQVDECVFYKDTVIFMVYVKDTILLSTHSESINVSLQALWTRFKLTEERDTAYYLRLQVTRLSTSTLSRTQPQRNINILCDLNFSKNTKSKNTPAVSTHLLQCGSDGKHFNKYWDYLSVIVKLNLLEKSSRPDLAFAMHQ